MKIYKEIISAVYPNKCMSCGEIIDEDDCLCTYCRNNIDKNNFDNYCVVCGQDKENCICGFNIYRFERLISVFKNDGVAQKAYYSYKFQKKKHYAKFFAQEMVSAVKLLYNDLHFDFICSVPPNKSFLRNSHFDHSGYLSDFMAKSMGISVYRNLLVCKKNKKQQHRLSFEKRLTNVDGKFVCNRRIDGASVLLVDDIRTTGATLDECAKTLLFAGADSVYCITALGSSAKNEKEN